MASSPWTPRRNGTGEAARARGLSSTIAVLAALAAYTVAWIYVVRQYNADKSDGLPLDFFLVPALGGAALAPPMVAHWLNYIWRGWRNGADQALISL
jgi:hypothetical protein